MSALALRQCQQQVCRVCEQAMTDEKRRESAQLDTLFGSLEYAICPNCSQQVSDWTFKDRVYRQRVERWRKENVHRLVAAAEKFRTKHGRWPWAS